MIVSASLGCRSAQTRSAKDSHITIALSPALSPDEVPFRGGGAENVLRCTAVAMNGSSCPNAPDQQQRFSAGDFACSYYLDRSDWSSYLYSGSCSSLGFRKDWCRFRVFLKSPNSWSLNQSSTPNCCCPSHHRCRRSLPLQHRHPHRRRLRLHRRLARTRPRSTGALRSMQQEEKVVSAP
jgi:hypothetical protein